MRPLTLMLFAVSGLALAQEPPLDTEEAAPAEEAAPVEEAAPGEEAAPAEVAAPPPRPPPTMQLPAKQVDGPYAAPAKPPIWEDDRVRRGPPADLERRELPPEARLEIAGELGSTVYRDEHYDLFSSTDALPIRGFRVGYRVIDRVVAQAAWSHGARGAEVLVGGDTSYDFDDDVASFHSAYFSDAFSLGAKVDVPLARRIVYPFVAARGQLAMQRIRLDDDMSDRQSLGQRQSSTVAPGYEVVGGVELRTPALGNTSTQLAWTLELGRAAVAEATFPELGTLRSGGFLARTGIGVRF